MIALKTDHDTYVGCENSGQAKAKRTRMGSREKFYIYATDNCDGFGTDPGVNCIAFKSYNNNKWLVAESDGAINCNRDDPGPWEKWYGWRDPDANVGIPSYEEYGDWVLLGNGYDGVYLIGETNVAYGYEDNYSDPQRKSDWVYADSFPNYNQIGKQGNIYA